MSRPAEHPEHGPYSDAVKELQADSTYELQRLASKMPDQLLVRWIFSVLVLLAYTVTGCLRPARRKSQRNHFLGDTGHEATDFLQDLFVHYHVSLVAAYSIT
jgi:hypothetical protein